MLTHKPGAGQDRGKAQARALLTVAASLRAGSDMRTCTRLYVMPNTVSTCVAQQLKSLLLKLRSLRRCAYDGMLSKLVRGSILWR